MPTIPSTTSTNPVVATSNASSTKTATPSGDTVTKNMFLQLLVAQIRNQDPMNPSDGVQFLTQLAQFQQMENEMNMSQDLAAMRADLDTLAAANTAGTQ